MEPQTANMPITVRKKLLILSVNYRKNDNSGFFIISTNEKSYLCFDIDLAFTLNDFIGLVCEVDTIITGNNKKIVKFFEAKEPGENTMYQPQKSTDTNPFSIPYALRLFETEVPILCKDKDEIGVRKVIEERRALISTDVIFFDNLNSELGNSKN